MKCILYSGYKNTGHLDLEVAVYTLTLLQLVVHWSSKYIISHFQNLQLVILPLRTSRASFNIF